MAAASPQSAPGAAPERADERPRELFLIDGNSLAYRAFFALPETIVTGLTPATANYRPTGSETVDGRPATEYSDTIELANLGFINPSLQGQRGTAPTTLTITNDRSILVGTEAEFKTSGGDTVARARQTVSDIGQVGPIAPPR